MRPLRERSTVRVAGCMLLEAFIPATSDASHGRSFLPRRICAVRAALCLLLSFAAFSAHAYGPTADELERRFERVLLPVWVPGVLVGAGSAWRSSFFAYNDSDEEVEFIPNIWFIDPLPPRSVLPPRVTTMPRMLCEPPMSANIFRAIPSRVVFVEREKVTSVAMNLTVTGPAGELDVPVVREHEFRQGRIQLLNVPFEPNQRLTVRVYDPDAQPGARAIVRLYSHNSTPLLQEVVVDFRTLSPEFCFTNVPSYPNYAEINRRGESVAQLPQFQRLRIEIEPLTPGLRIWAMATVTDNETQNVRLIAPW